MFHLSTDSGGISLADVSRNAHVLLYLEAKIYSTANTLFINIEEGRGEEGEEANR